MEEKIRDSFSATDSAAERLLSTDSETTLAHYEGRSRLKACHYLHFAILYSYNLAITIALVVFIFRGRSSFSMVAYSPANVAVSYRAVTFEPGTPDQLSAYQGEPTAEKNKLWEDLYERGGASRISNSEAQRLLKPSYEIPDSGRDHVVQLEVFHQLHCLNTLRRSLWPDHFPKYALTGQDGKALMHRVMHADHCVDRIRQGILCASNVGVSFWKRRPGTSPAQNDTFENRLAIDMRSTNTCRDFSEIQKWAFDREMEDWEGMA